MLAPGARPCVNNRISGRMQTRSVASLPARITRRKITTKAAATPTVFGGKVYVDPTVQEIKAFAPATVANLGPGYDWMGCAVHGGGDTVTARVLADRPGEVVIEKIEGDDGRLSLVAEDNCIGIAAIETLKLLGQPSCGVSLTLHKGLPLGSGMGPSAASAAAAGLPLGSGMGSSAASAAAAAWAVNGLFGSPLPKSVLVTAGLASEAAVSGYHADNIAPALLGGFVLVRSCKLGEPVELIQLPFTRDDLFFVLVNPKFGAPTAKMSCKLGEPVELIQLPFTRDDLFFVLVNPKSCKLGEPVELIQLPFTRDDLFFVLVNPKSCKLGEPVELIQLPFTRDDLFFVLVNPKFEAPTAKMRAALPKEVPLSSMINNSCQGGALGKRRKKNSGPQFEAPTAKMRAALPKEVPLSSMINKSCQGEALVAGILQGDVRLIGESLDSDIIIEPCRGPLIPGMLAVKAAAKAAAVAIVDSLELGQKVAEAMCKAFKESGGLEINTSEVVKLDMEGARFV
eukprot:gene2206-33766_t